MFSIDSGKKKIREILIILIATLLVFVVRNVTKSLGIKNTESMGATEIKVAQTYTKVEEDDDKTQSDFVKFDAFVLKDLDGDGNAEKIRGTCKEIGSQDILYMELNVNSEGTLKDAKIQIDGKNFYLATALVSDNIIDGNYISSRTDSIELQEIKEGTNALIQGTILSGNYSYASTKSAAIQNGNINNYSRNDNKITLEGTYVNSQGVEQEIKKDVYLTVDWYGNVRANIDAVQQRYKIDKENLKVKFNVQVSEIKRELMLSKLYVKGTIPQLNGYSPIEAHIPGGEYNKETRGFYIEKSSQVHSDGTIENQVNRDYIFEIEVEYPQEAFLNNRNGNFVLNIPVLAYFEAYNNLNIYENGIVKSEPVEKEIQVIVFWEIDEKDYVYSTSINKRLNKRNVLDVYKGIENITNDTYEVEWQLLRMKETQGNDIVLKQERMDAIGSVETDCIKNVGIYFSGNIVDLLGENGVIKLYNNETNELIKQFDKTNWNQTYYYSEDIKFIRIETSSIQSAKDNKLGSIKVNNIKKIDSLMLSNSMTKEELLKHDYIYNYSTAICGNQVSAIATAEYITPASTIALTTNKTNISSQVENEISLTINASNRLEQSWKDGKFLIKLPSQIVKADINNIETNDSNVNISKYSTYEQDGNIFIQVETQNEKPTNFSISLDMNIKCDPMTRTSYYNIEVYAINPENEVYDLDSLELDVYDINNNNENNDYVLYTRTGINMIAPNNLITTENIIDENGNVIAQESENLEIDKKDLDKTQKIEIKIFNNYSGGDIRDVLVVGKVPFKNNTYVIDGSDMGSDYSVSMISEGITIPEELKGKVKIYYSEKDEVTRDLNDSNNAWIENPEDFSKVKSYLIDLSELVLKIGDIYSFTYEIDLPSDIQYNQNSYSTHAVYFSLETDEGKLQQRVETNKLGILVAKKYNLEITDYEEFTTEPVKGITYRISDDENNIIGTTDENGKVQIKNLYVEKEYTITKTKVTPNYECDITERKIKVYSNEDVLTIENIAGEFKTQEVVNEEQLVKLSLENKAKYALNLTKIESETQNNIGNVKFLLKGKGISENGVMLQTSNDGNVYVSGLYQDEIYTLKEIYAEGYKEIKEEIRFKVESSNGIYIANDLDNKFKEITVNKITGKIPELVVVLENEREDSYTFNLTKYQKNSDKVVPNTKFNIKGKWFEEDGEEYITNRNGEIELTLYGGYEYTIKEIEAAEGYVLNEQEIKFIATKNSEGNWEFVVTQGNFKEDVNIVNNTIYAKLENEKTFEIIKQDEETGKLLKGVKFVIYKVERQEDGTEKLLEAKNINGEVIGREETINKIQYRVLETDENGRIQESLEAGLYKAIEVQALEGYYLGDLDEHTYYFGIDESQKGESQITIKAEYPDVIQTSMTQTNDGGYIGVYKEKITKYNSQFEVEWENSSELVSNSVTSYKQAIQTNDGGYLAISSISYYISGSYLPILTKFNFNGDIEWEEEVIVSGNVGNLLLTKDNHIMFAVANKTYNYSPESVQGIGEDMNISILKYNLKGEYIWQKAFFVGHAKVQGVQMLEDNDGNFVVYTGWCDYTGGAHLFKINREGDTLWTKLLSVSGTIGYDSEATSFEDACIASDGGYIFVGSSAERTEYGVYGRYIYEYNYYSEYSGIIAKYTKQGELEWIKAHDDEERFYGILKLKDGSYIVQGKVGIYKYSSEFELEAKYEFDGTILNHSGDRAQYRMMSKNLSLVNNDGILISIDDEGYESIESTTLLNINKEASSIPEKTEIRVYNALKEYEITTACGENGNISGKEEFLYEKVKHGKDSTKEIVVTPNEGYRVLDISINGENINFIEEEDKSVKIPMFKNVTQDKRIYATFIEETKMGEIIVNHYKTDTEESVAEKQIIRGNVDEDYATNPKPYISNYSLNVEQLPTNARGKIKSETTYVTYYYDESPVKIVTSYIDMETNEFMQQDNIQYKNIGETYETQGLSEIPEGYELYKEPENKTGTITGEEENSEIEVVYYYRLKNYVIKTNVVNDGGTISGQGKDAYEIVKHGQNAEKEIEILPYEGYKVLNIKVNDIEIEFVTNDDRIVILENLLEVKENKIITAEFEKVKAQVIIKHIDKETNEEIAEREVKEGNFGEEYVALSKEIEGYTLVEPLPQNVMGQFGNETIIIEYYYEKDKPDIPDEPDIPDVPGEPDVPEIPDEPDEPDLPNEPIIPGNKQDVEEQKDKQENKIELMNPATGDYIITAIYILIVTIIINVVITIKGKEGKE